MRFAGSQSWQLRWGDDRAVNAALYLRDALALSVHTEPDIPLLTPPVPVSVPAGVDRAAVTREWPAWWSDVLAHQGAEPIGSPEEQFASWPDVPGSPALTGRPAIRAALAAFEPEFGPYANRLKTWVAPPPHTAGIGDLVRAKEAELGRKARPFRLVVTELPVAGLFWHRLSTEHVLLSVSFAQDTARRDAALRKVLDEVA